MRVVSLTFGLMVSFSGFYMWYRGDEIVDHMTQQAIRECGMALPPALAGSLGHDISGILFAALLTLLITLFVMRYPFISGVGFVLSWFYIFMQLGLLACVLFFAIVFAFIDTRKFVVDKSYTYYNNTNLHGNHDF